MSFDCKSIPYIHPYYLNYVKISLRYVTSLNVFDAICEYPSTINLLERSQESFIGLLIEFTVEQTSIYQSCSFKTTVELSRVGSAPHHFFFYLMAQFHC